MYDFWITSLIWNAVFEKDIDAIEQIVSRVDGGIPDAKERDLYANYFGAALDDVLSLTDSGQCHLFPDDPVIIALAKCAVAISLTPAADNVQAIKAKNKAIALIFDRAEGRKSAPVARSEIVSFTDPAWMKGLPYEEVSDSSGSGDQRVCSGAGDEDKEVCGEDGVQQ